MECLIYFIGPQVLDTLMDQMPDMVAESDPDSDEDALPRPKNVPFDRHGGDHLDSSGK